MIRIQFRTEQKELNPLPLGAIDDLQEVPAVGETIGLTSAEGVRKYKVRSIEKVYAFNNTAQRLGVDVFITVELIETKKTTVKN